MIPNVTPKPLPLVQLLEITKKEKSGATEMTKIRVKNAETTSIFR
jgi:hypothetical protein